jgi:NAD-dependent dihydropyrimidine dehydrogenase PreA subunit
MDEKKDEKKCYIEPNPSGPTVAVVIDSDRCVGCNSCVNICRIQTLLPNPEKGQPPIVDYPDECWYCGCCVEACPRGALEMKLPINQRIMFKRKETGEVYRLGADDCPKKSYFKPPVG